jgi:hypothetical protein
MRFLHRNTFLHRFLHHIPATSAAVERFFSKTSFILRKHRRSMSEKLAEQLFFLKENYQLIK